MTARAESLCTFYGYGWHCERTRESHVNDALGHAYMECAGCGLSCENCGRPDYCCDSCPRLYGGYREK
jgi:hypothetical protein